MPTTKKASKFLMIFFLIVFAAQMLGLLFLIILPEISQAADIKFKPQVQIGDFAGGIVKPNSIGLYIQAIYKYAIGVVGIVAAAAIMWGGFGWITAAGNPQGITEAKGWITSAFLGLFLAMSSWLILNTINPALVQIQEIAPITIEGLTIRCCDIKHGLVSPRAEKSADGKSIGYVCPNTAKTLSNTQSCGKITGESNYRVTNCSWQTTALISICQWGYAADADSQCIGEKPTPSLDQRVKCCCTYN